MRKERLFTPQEAEVAYRFEPALQNALLGDWEGVKITNYQLAGEHAAQRIKEVVGDNPVLEVCTGIGAITLVLARSFPKVYAIDLDSKRLQMCDDNIDRLGLSDKVELINGDILDDNVLQRLSGQNIGAVYTDVNFTTGDDWQNHTTDINATGPNTVELYKKVTDGITGNICMKLPKTINLEQLRALAPCEIEEVKPDGKLSFYLVYFGDLVKADSSEFAFPKHAYPEQDNS